MGADAQVHRILVEHDLVRAAVAGHRRLDRRPGAVARRIVRDQDLQW